MTYAIHDDLTSDEATIFFFSDPSLAFMGLSDEELALMYTTKLYLLDDTSHYLAVRDDKNILVCIVKYDWFTTHCVNLHMYISTKFHGTEEVRKITEIIEQYGKDHPKMLKAVLMVPSSCDQVHDFAPKWGWVQEGRITNCYKWREQVVDIVIYGLKLK